MRSQPRQLSPKQISLLLVLVVSLSYAYFFRPVEISRDVAIIDQTLYLVTSSDGIRVFSLEDPLKPSFIRLIPTHGSAQAITISGDKLYMAEGRTGVRVFNINDRQNPVEIASFNTPGFAQSIAVDGKQILVADGSKGVRILEMKEDDKPKIEGVGEFKVRGQALHVAVQDNRLIVTDSGHKLNIVNTKDPKKPEVLGTFDTRAPVNSFMFNGNTGYLAATKRGVVVIDITDLKKITEIATFDTPGEANQVEVFGDTVYIADGKQGLRVFDFSNRSRPKEIAFISSTDNTFAMVMKDRLVYLADGLGGLRVIRAQVEIKPEAIGATPARFSATSVFFNENKLYVAAGEAGMLILNITDTRKPVELNAMDTPGYVSKVVVVGDLAYLADKNEGLRLVDISNPNRALETLTTINQNRETFDVLIHGDFIYLADGSFGLTVIDNTIPKDPLVVGELDTPGSAVRLTALGDMAAIADGIAGVQFVNLGNPKSPMRIGSFDTPGEARGVALMVTVAAKNKPSRTYALVADGSRGLRVLDVTEIKSIKEVFTWEKAEYYLENVVIQDSKAYIAAREKGLLVFDLADPLQPKMLASFDTSGKTNDVILANTLGILADSDHGVRFVNLADPLKPTAAGFFDLPQAVNDFALNQNKVYLADGIAGFWGLDMPSAAAFQFSGYLTTTATAEKVAFLGNFVAVAKGKSGFDLIDISKSADFSRVASVDTPGIAQAIFLRDTQAYVADGPNGLHIYDLSNPTKIVSLGEVDTPGDARQLSVVGDYAYIADGSGGMQIVKVSNPRAPARNGAFATPDARAVAIRGKIAFLGAGANGLIIMDVSRPYDPKKIGELKTDAPVVDIFLVGEYAFLSKEKNGIDVIEITDPTAPLRVGTYSLPTPALKTMVITRTVDDKKPDEFVLYVACAEDGIQVLSGQKFSNPKEEFRYETPGNASAMQLFISIPALVTFNFKAVSPRVVHTIKTVCFDFLFIATLGLILWAAFFSQYTLPISTLRERFSSIFLIMLYLLGFHGPAVHAMEGRLISHEGESERKFPGVVLVDLCSAILLRRKKVAYPFPIEIIFKLLEGTANLLVGPPPRPTKPPQPVLRVVGPGLVFTRGRRFPFRHQYYESIEKVADLRPQVRNLPDVLGYTRDGIELKTSINVIFTLGEPADILDITYQGEQIPENLRILTIEEDWIPAGSDEHRRRVKIVKDLQEILDGEDRDEIHRRVQAWLKNPQGKGVDDNDEDPISADNEQDGNGVPFKFYPNRVFRAMAAEALDPALEHPHEWTDLPAQVATGVFRNLLAREMFDHLYLPDEPNRYPLRDLRGNFRNRIRHMGVLAFRFISLWDKHPIEKKWTWDEKEINKSPVFNLRNPKVLRARGIKVVHAGFGELKPVNPGVGQQRFEYWQARWQRERLLTEADYDLDVERIRNQGRVQGQRDLAFTLSRVLQESPRSREALALQVFQALENAATNPATRQLLPDATINLMGRVNQWLAEGIGERLDTPEGPVNE